VATPKFDFDESKFVAKDVSDVGEDKNNCVDLCVRRKLAELEQSATTAFQEKGAYCSLNEKKSLTRGMAAPQNYIFTAARVSRIFEGSCSIDSSFPTNTLVWTSRCNGDHAEYIIEYTIKRVATGDEIAEIYRDCKAQCGVK